MWKLLFGSGTLQTVSWLTLEIFQSFPCIVLEKRITASQKELRKKFNFCPLWRPGTNCLTYEKLIRWLINYVCGKKKIYQWAVWGFRRALKLITKGILCSRSHSGWAFVLLLCWKMMNTELFFYNSLVVPWLGN